MNNCSYPAVRWPRHKQTLVALPVCCGNHLQNFTFGNMVQKYFDAGRWRPSAGGAALAGLKGEWRESVVFG